MPADSASLPSSTTTLQSLSDELATAAATASRSLVAIHARRRIPSSGVVWRPGVVVTAHHTIQRDEGITVTLADGTTVGATLAGRDPSTDLAVLRLASEVGVPITRAPLASARVGQLVLALGMPGAAATAALGIVSSVGGEWRTWHGGRIDQFIHLDVAIHDGFSGGAAIDVSGRMLGINSSGLARASAMTIPLATIERVVEQLVANGRVRRGYIGLGVQPVRLPAGVVRAQSLSRDVALMVISIEEGGPAHAAGIFLGDVLVAADGRPVADPGDLLATLTGDRIDTPVTIRLLRGGAPHDIAVTVGERRSARE
ncbi:MAG: trypsin-like peptidase domain-containing protein [Gemmatimonadaceae bacterium]|nr:trypsin-like peptidase domain-containing protein [Gemmatimonadaceae bacterium]